jgi:anti-sigma regulatory factor (Ser/Thr protein kinase)
MLMQTDLVVDPNVPRRVRVMLTRFKDALSASAYQCARLLASEAASNAVRHGAAGGSIHVQAELDNGVFRLEVTNDSGEKRPHFAVRDATEGGLGMYILDQLADSWGTEHNDHTVVWFELRSA